VAAGLGVGVAFFVVPFLTGLDVGSDERWARSARLEGTGLGFFAALGLLAPLDWQPAASSSTQAAEATAAGRLSIRMTSLSLSPGHGGAE
jgi:hypothetical protein